MESIFEQGRHPAICTPITGRSEQEVIHQLDRLITQKPDILEWRADFFSGLMDTEKVLAIISNMKQKTTIPILFTIRAMHEGGEKISLDDEERAALICEVCKQSTVEFIDYETSNESQYVSKVKKASKEYGKQLILSYHNFQSTPEEEVLKERAQLAVEHGADIVKIAVMPESKRDVYRLLEVTRVLDGSLSKPIVTISMGETGALSRVIGWVYGSALTFAVGVEASAPGQIAVGDLRKTISSMKEILPKWN